MTSRPAFYSQNENQNYFVHEGKTSSRVLQAPGGKSSINLCWDNHIDDDENTKISNNTFANGNNMNYGNVLTERPSSRVLNPPGGKSTICLG